MPLPPVRMTVPYTLPMPRTSASNAPMELVALGVPISVHFTGSGAHRLAEVCQHAWQDCLAPRGQPSAPEAAIEACLDPDPSLVGAASRRGAVAHTDVDRLMERLTQVITERAITANAGRLTMLHAVALSHPATGATIVLPAPSGTGKTTVARCLGSRFGYVSDETVGIRHDGRIVTYPKPLSVLPSSGLRIKAQLPATDLGLLPPIGDLRLAAIVKLARSSDGPKEPEIERVSTVRGVYEIGPEVSYLTRHPRPLHRLQQLLESVGGLTILRYRDAGDLAPVVHRLLEPMTP